MRSLKFYTEIVSKELTTFALKKFNDLVCIFIII